MRLAAFEVVSLMLICDSQLVCFAIINTRIILRYIVARKVPLELAGRRTRAVFISSLSLIGGRNIVSTDRWGAKVLAKVLAKGTRLSWVIGIFACRCGRWRAP
jgi:hypothetical protein